MIPAKASSGYIADDSMDVEMESGLNLFSGIYLTIFNV